MNTSRSRSWRSRFYLAVLTLAVALLLADQVVRAVGNDSLHHSLGNVAYNRIRPLLGVLGAALVLLGAVTVDGLLRVVVVARGWVRRRRASARSLAVPAALALVFIAAMPLLVREWQARNPDPLLDEPLAWLLDERTHFAPGCTDGAFAGLAPGMSRAEVEARVGEPLADAATSGGYMATYSRGAGGGSYRERIVVYDHREGRVRRVVAGLFVDWRARCGATRRPDIPSGYRRRTRLLFATNRSSISWSNASAMRRSIVSEWPV